MRAIPLTPANRDHEATESQLRDLMERDKKLIEKHDTLVEQLLKMREEMAEIAKQKFGLLPSLGTLYKKYANGHNGKKEATE